MKVMWNTGADDATGEVVSADPNFGDAVVRRDPGHNGGVEYRLPLTALWAITDPPYQRRAFLDREYPVVEQHPLNIAIEEAERCTQ